MAISLALSFASFATGSEPSHRLAPAPKPRAICPPAAGSFAGYVTEAAHRFAIPEAWIGAVIRAESFGDARAVSPMGAIGLMQIMPDTYQVLRLRYGLGANPCDPHDNIFAGVAYLRELLDRYGSPGFLAAYNAGPARYEERLASGRPLPAETLAYVAKLAPFVGNQPADDQAGPTFDLLAWARATLFPAQSDDLRAVVQQPPNPQWERPPVASRIVDLSALAPQPDGLFVRTAGEDRAP